MTGTKPPHPRQVESRASLGAAALCSSFPSVPLTQPPTHAHTQGQQSLGQPTMSTSEPPDSSLLKCVLAFSTKTDAAIDDFTDLFSTGTGAFHGEDCLNYQDEQGRCPLGVVATMAGRPMLVFVKAFVEGRAKLRLKDARLRTPLLLAAEHNRTQIFLYLLDRLSQCEKGWQLAEEQDCYQRGPLHFMCQHRNAEGVRALLAVAAAPAVGGRVGEEEEKKERIKTVVNARTSSGETPLFWLVQSLTVSQKEEAGMEEGGNQKKKKSSSTSSGSSSSGPINDDTAAAVLEIAELLLATGADSQAGNAMGQTPMDLLSVGEDGGEGGVKAQLRSLLSSQKASKDEGEEEEDVKECGSSTMAAGASSVHAAAVAPARGMLASFPTRDGGFGTSSSSSSNVSSNSGSNSSSGRSGGSAPKKLKIKLKAPAAKEQEK